MTRISLVNSTVDVAYGILRDSVGTQGTLDNRLAQSSNEDGSLKAAAIDEALHNIGSHEDGMYLGVEYVRMLKAESDKLELIADSATDVKLQSPDGNGGDVLFDSGTVELEDSIGITWSVSGGNKVKANLAFPAAAAHAHYYDLTPVTSNYKDYTTTSVSTPFIDGSLRVHINGIRLSAVDSVYVPLGVSRTLTLMKFSTTAASGLFSLSAMITSLDIIKIDFDISYV